MKYNLAWLQSYIQEPLPPVADIAELITMHTAEIEGIETFENGHTVLDVKILPDRAHDLYSHQYMARELCTLLGYTYMTPAQDVCEAVIGEKTTLSVSIETEKCRRYMARVVRGVQVGESPLWLREYLESLGQKSINNMVDATNYVLFATGQPTHVFDAKKLDGGIVVRMAHTGENIQLLGGTTKELTAKDMVVADSAGALALAGVKGGTKAELTQETTDIVLEVANFDPSTVRKTARGYDLLTDAAKRFENDYSPELAFDAMQLLIHIVTMLGGGTPEEVVDVYPYPEAPTTVHLRRTRAEQVLGREISEEACDSILQKAGFKHTKTADALYGVAIPPVRRDLRAEHDMIEEIGRLLGYGSILPVLPAFTVQPEKNKVFYTTAYLKEFLIAQNFHEVYGYSFTDTGEKSVLSPLAKDKAYLRTNLESGIEKALQHNFNYRDFLGTDAVCVFEIGNVFMGDKEGTRLCIGIQSAKAKDLKKIQDALQENFPTHILSLVSEKTEGGVWVGEYAIDLKTDISESVQLPTATRENTVFQKWSAYPYMVRDIAVWGAGSENEKEILTNLYTEKGGDLLVKAPMLFDEFSKEGRTSYGYRFIFQAYDRTLESAEVDSIMVNITTDLISNGFEVR